MILERLGLRDRFGITIGGVLACAVLLVVGLFMVFLAGVSGALYYGCNVLEDETGRDTKYHWWSGCYVRFGDEWVPRDQWRYVEEESR